jgi:hypothetical protein
MMVKKTFGEICDELSILALKRKRLGKRFNEKQKARFYMLFRAYVKMVWKLDPDKGENAKQFLRKLHATNSEIWNLEESLRNLEIEDWYEGKKRYEEMGKRAESIREINEYRNKYKNKLNELFGDVEDIKVNHISGKNEDHRR